MTFFDVLLRSALAVGTIIFLVRLNGLRSFSKMSSFDFALTVATGSLVAGLITTTGEIWPHLYALISIFIIQFIVSKLRVTFTPIEALIDNSPLLLMHEGRFVEGNLRKARVTESDVIGKLREANAYDLCKVRAVVLEATGDISVLHGEGSGSTVLKGVDRG